MAARNKWKYQNYIVTIKMLIRPKISYMFGFFKEAILCLTTFSFSLFNVSFTPFLSRSSFSKVSECVSVNRKCFDRPELITALLSIHFILSHSPHISETPSLLFSPSITAPRVSITLSRRQGQLE